MHLGCIVVTILSTFASGEAMGIPYSVVSISEPERANKAWWFLAKRCSQWGMIILVTGLTMTSGTEGSIKATLLWCMVWFCHYRQKEEIRKREHCGKGIITGRTF